jgi:WD40 repeat protein
MVSQVAPDKKRKAAPITVQPEVISCTYSRNGKQALLGNWDGGVELWDTAQSAQAGPIYSWSAGNKPVCATAFNADRRFYLTGVMDGMLSFWNTDGSGKKWSYLAHLRPISGILHAYSHQCWVTSSWDCTLSVWADEPPRQKLCLRKHKDIVAGTSLMLDGSRILSWSHDGNLRVWELPDGRDLACWKGNAGVPIHLAALSPDGRWIVSAGRDGSLSMWDAESRDEAARHACPEFSELRGCSFTPDAKTLLTVSRKGKIVGLTVPDLMPCFERETGIPIQCSALSPSGQRFLVGTADGKIHLQDLSDLMLGAIWVTPTEREENRPGLLRRILKLQKLYKVLQCLCPACGLEFEWQDEKTTLQACPKCQLSLQLSPFRVRSTAMALGI